MTIYRTTLHLDFARRFEGLVIHSRHRPTWSMIHAQIEERLDAIAAEMNEDGRDDYEKLAARRSSLRKMQAIFPGGFKHISEDDVPIGSGGNHPRAIVTEIKVV